MGDEDLTTTAETTETEGSTLGGEGTSDQSAKDQQLGWRRQLGKESWEDDFAKGFDGVPALFRHAKELNVRLEGSIPKLGEDPSEEDLATYHKAMGVPETAENYALDIPEGVPKGFAESVQKMAFDAKLTPMQAQEVVNANIRMLAAQTEAQNRRTVETRTKLKSSFGNELQAKVDAANNHLEKVGGKELLELFNDPAIGGNETLVRYVIAMAEAVSEDSIEIGDPGGGRTEKRTDTGMPLFNFSKLHEAYPEG